MTYRLGDIILRRPEASDLPALYAFKNDPEVASLLGGFSTGYAMADLEEWLQSHRRARDEVLWSIVHAEDGACLGHVGLYRIDHRVRSAEYAIMIGDRSAWGRGIGRACTQFAIAYGFEQLNLNRIELSVLATNQRALALYASVGFVEEGRKRQAQYKDGAYCDVIMMALLRDEYTGRADA